MPAQITGLVGRLQSTMRQFSLAQRTLGLIGLAVVVLGGMALYSWIGKPTLSPLFADLSATDASAIVDHLDGAGVEYQLTDGGSTIMVPADKVYTMRLEVAGAGLPTSSDGGGYSLLDNMPMTSSDFQQQVTYQRALEGELARTIGAIDGVEVATVKLALPEESVFVQNAADPTASVFIETTPGTTMDSAKVQSIVHLVSAGIQGMAPTDVAVIDADGRVLSAVGSGAATGLSDGQTSEYEAGLSAGLQAMLDRLVGVGNAVVTVNADLNYDQTVRTTETQSTNPTLPPVSADTSKEQYTGTSAASGGVLGSDNIAVPTTDDGNGDYTRETSTVNNAVDTVTEQLTTAPGAVRRQSVSVVISQDAGASLDLIALQTAVAAAAGIDPARGDIVSVTRMAFDTSTAEVAQEALAAADKQAEKDKSTELIKSVSIPASVVVFLIFLILIGMRRGRRARREALDLGELELVEARKAETIKAVVEPRALPAAPTPEVNESTGRRDDIMALAAEQPAEVAEVLRGWLVGGRR